MSEIESLNLPNAIKYFEDDTIENIWASVHLYEESGFKTLMKIDREYLLGMLRGDHEMSRAAQGRGCSSHRVMNVHRDEGNVYIH